ncbi:hypothetical protein HPB48_007543 [Haemaphysalis longicornis]|uniref:Uncharacterized protein n=1 Tax=Haemaphysalis longicornis TaxID=44386 RepID=A0A9J6FW20_HAELO|nr:hypothetical protein HPB48_007543 [Haemaphysalis longicornis]
MFVLRLSPAHTRPYSVVVQQSAASQRSSALAEATQSEVPARPPAHPVEAAAAAPPPPKRAARIPGSAVSKASLHTVRSNSSTHVRSARTCSVLKRRWTQLKEVLRPRRRIGGGTP